MVKRISNIINYLENIEINEIIEKIPDIDIKDKKFCNKIT